MATIDSLPLFHTMSGTEQMRIVLDIRKSRLIVKKVYNLSDVATSLSGKRQRRESKGVGKEKVSRMVKRLSKEQAASLLRILGGEGGGA